MFESSIGTLAPGPELAATVADLDPRELSDDQLLEVAAAGKRLAAWAESLMLDAVAGFCDRRGPDTIPLGRAAPDRTGGVRSVRYGADGTPEVEEFAAEEVAVALTISPGSARNLIGHALDLRHRFPRVRAALASGTVDGFRARIVTTVTTALDHATAARVEEKILPKLARVTTGQLDKLVAAELITADPDTADHDIEQAQTFKGVWPTPNTHPGLAGMTAELDTDAMARLDQTISTVARLLRRTGRTEPWQQLRADALGMLADPTSVDTLRTHVTETATTAAADHAATHGEAARSGPAGDGAAGRSGPGRGGGRLPSTVLYVHAHADGRFELDRHGPITSGQAHRILRHSNVVIKPVIDLNQRLAADSYQIPEPIKETIQLRDRTCRFPGCPRPARRCETDHTIPWPHGPTTPANLCCLCTRHHRMKTHSRWQLQQPFAGILIWRSPTGSIHITHQRETTHVGHPTKAGIGSHGS
jgi:hypothetical protein